jgi:molybdenum cofactor cytidylyltransferase
MTARPQVCALVLAAGSSRRMGARNKLLTPIDGADGRPMVARVVDAALASHAVAVLVVTGAEEEAVHAALADRPVGFAHNAAHDEGLSTSLRAGLAALPADTDGVLVCLADMPWVGAPHLNALIDAFAEGDGQDVCAPVHEGRRGNPVLWPARCFEAMRALRGDVGARELLRAEGRRLRLVDVGDDAIHRDVDTIEDLNGRAGE